MTLWEFLRMGGYGIYVWPVYLLAALSFVAVLGWLWRQKRRLLSGGEEEE